MSMPEVWFLFGANIHQDFLLDYPDFVSGILAIVQDLNSEQLKELFLFVHELIESDHTLRHKCEIWDKSGTMISVTPSEINMLLSEVYSVVKESMTTQGYDVDIK